MIHMAFLNMILIVQPSRQLQPAHWYRDPRERKKNSNKCDEACWQRRGKEHNRTRKQ
ncbi:hypothetical protein PVAP13_5KG341607 [Panicum virgatum]|uniref:Uncharacterized protein n=1 Tax=Panicum virgatum TaxID=38727 RepID=A0A8T0SGM8_PANVG|nr:hypothetical protein PVAP13_5KG341607 [Panicum virgatum]